MSATAASLSAITPAVGLVTDADIERAYDLCAIIRVCELAVAQIPDLGQDAMVNEVTGDVARLLRFSGKMAFQSLNALELAEKR